MVEIQCPHWLEDIELVRLCLLSLVHRVARTECHDSRMRAIETIAFALFQTESESEPESEPEPSESGVSSSPSSRSFDSEDSPSLVDVSAASTSTASS